MSGQDFEIAAVGKVARLTPLLIGGLAPLAIIAALAMSRTPAPWPEVLPALIVLPAIALLLAWSMHGRKVELREHSLGFSLLPWRRTPIAQLDVAAARVLDLDRERDWQPQLKLFGSRLPGYCSGWFWLRNRRRAQVLLTDRRRVLLLPRRDGTVILLSVLRPDALLAALQQADDRPPAAG